MWQVIITKRALTTRGILFFLYMIQVRLFAWGKSPNLSVIVFVIVCFVSSDWVTSKGGLLVLWTVTGFILLRVRTRYKKRWHWWWDLKSSNDSLRTRFPPSSFSFAQIYTVLHLFLYVHVAEWLWMHLGVCRDSMCRYQGCARTALPTPLLSFHVWEFELLHPDCSTGIRLFELQKEIN